MTETKKPRLDYIDALRGLAIFGVILVHSLGFINGKVPDFFVKIVGSGARGVQLFFIISAFSLFLSLENKKGEKYPILNYFIRRFFRIAPLFYFAISVYLLKDGLYLDGFGTNYWLGDAKKISVLNIIATHLFINGWYPYWINSVIGVNWTIAIEMSFYLFVPFLFKKIKNVLDAIILVLFSNLVLIFTMPFLKQHSPISDQRLWNDYLYLWLPSQLPFFFLGIVLYFIIYPEKAQPVTEFIFSKFRRFLIFILLTMFFISSIFFDQVVFMSQFGLFFLLFIYVLSRYPSFLFVNKFWIYLGKISYSAYLVHLMALSMTKFLFGNIHTHIILESLLIFSSTLVLTILIGSFTYRLIEKPGIIFGNRLIEKIEKENKICVFEFFKKLSWVKRI